MKMPSLLRLVWQNMAVEIRVSKLNWPQVSVRERDGY